MIFSSILALALTNGCANQSAKIAPLPGGSPVIRVAMLDYRFKYRPATVPAGRVLFRVKNSGKVNHQLALYPLTEDFPPINEQLHGPVRRILQDFGSIPGRRPGQEGAFVVNLVPGKRYAMICFLLDAQGRNHALRGMNTEFRTPGAVLKSPETAAKLTPDSAATSSPNSNGPVGSPRP